MNRIGIKFETKIDQNLLNMLELNKLYLKINKFTLPKKKFLYLGIKP